MSAAVDPVAPPTAAHAAFFRALGDETRLRSLVLLHAAGELCVCDLTEILGLAQPKMSRHLATLREAGIVQGRRAGAWIHYRISPCLPDWQSRTLECACAELIGRAPFAQDCQRLADLPRRRDGQCGDDYSGAAHDG